MARRDNHSESDTNTGGNNSTAGPSTSGMTARQSTKQRNQMLQQQQKELLARHIHQNGPNDFPKKDPMDFSNWTETELRNYRDVYFNANGVYVDDIKTFQGYLCESEVGKQTETYLKNELYGANNEAAASANSAAAASGNTNPPNAMYDHRDIENLRKRVEMDFTQNVNVKESEVITSFMYKVKNEDKKFRMYFDRRL